MLNAATFAPVALHRPDGGGHGRTPAQALEALAQRHTAHAQSGGLSKSAAPDDAGAVRSEPVAFAKAAKHVVRDALRTMKQDVKGLLKSMGFDRDVAKGLAKSLIQPVKVALKSGADFTAQIAVAAAQQTTEITSSGISQSLSLVARSLDLTVNHSTGEVSVQVQSVSIEQNVSLRFSEPFTAPPAFDEADPVPAVPEELRGLLDQLLAGEGDDNPVPTERLRLTPEAVDGGERAREVDDELDDLDELEVLDDEDVVPASEPRARFQLRDVAQFHDSLGQFLTRVRLDAAVPLESASRGESLISRLLEGGYRGGFDLSA